MEACVVALVAGSSFVVAISPSVLHGRTCVALVPGLKVAPPTAIICRLSARISPTRAFNSSVFAEISIVFVFTTASALSLAAFLAVLSSDKSDEEHPGDR